ncbi:hypothetical protein pb186bvf_000297 [Paramecium bursaria]
MDFRINQIYILSIEFFLHVAVLISIFLTSILINKFLLLLEWIQKIKYVHNQVLIIFLPLIYYQVNMVLFLIYKKWNSQSRIKRLNTYNSISRFTNSKKRGIYTILRRALKELSSQKALVAIKGIVIVQIIGQELIVAIHFRYKGGTFYLINETRIEQILKINLNQFLNNQKEYIKPIQSIDEKVGQIKTVIYENTQKKYQIKKIDETHKYFYASQISNDEKYIAYGGTKIQEYTILNKIRLFKYLCLSIFGFDVKNDFQEIFKQEQHYSQNIYNIRTIENKYLIICSAFQIMKIDIQSKQEIFHLYHANDIQTIDYNDDMLISAGNDESIRYWGDCKTQSPIISKETDHCRFISQIQLINNNQNALSLDWGYKLFKWKIDLIQKDLIKLQVFKDPNNISYFIYMNESQNLTLICENYIKILNDEGFTIAQQPHQALEHQYFLNYQDDKFGHGECRQLDNGRLIHIRSYKIIMLAIAED